MDLRRDHGLACDSERFCKLKYAHLLDVYTSEGGAYLERTRWDPKAEITIEDDRSGERFHVAA